MVEVYSNTFKSWCSGRVERIEADGAAFVTYTTPDRNPAQKVMPLGHPDIRRSQQQPQQPQQQQAPQVGVPQPTAADFGVVVDSEEDIVVPREHRRNTCGLNMASVHGTFHHIAKQEHGVDATQAAPFQPNPSASQIANQVVAAAVQMASQVAQEATDVLDSQWRGPGGQDPLLTLFGDGNIQNVAANLERLASETQRVLASQPSLVEAPLPAKVYGDIHGQFRDMLLLLHFFNFPSQSSPTQFVFNGDWVDRGAHQVEVVALVLALKAVFPNKVWLLRGNHEDAVQNQSSGGSGFHVQCNQRLGQMGPRIFSAVNQTWNWLPFGCVVGRKILVVHGGIGDGRWGLNYLAQIRRPVDHDALPRDPILYNVLWSDPIMDEGDPRQVMGVHDSPRDNHAHLCITFGPDVSEDFCARNGLGAVVRSHQAFDHGMGYDVMHNGRCIRVFSARDYGNGEMANNGAVLSITQGKGHVLVRAQVVKSMRQ